jgi:hypothetical protein
VIKIGEQEAITLSNDLLENTSFLLENFMKIDKNFMATELKFEKTDIKSAMESSVLNYPGKGEESKNETYTQGRKQGKANH